jgi:hypothetical protein
VRLNHGGRRPERERLADYGFSGGEAFGGEHAAAGERGGNVHVQRAGRTIYGGRDRGLRGSGERSDDIFPGRDMTSSFQRSAFSYQLADG